LKSLSLLPVFAAPKNVRALGAAHIPWSCYGPSRSATVHDIYFYFLSRGSWIGQMTLDPPGKKLSLKERLVGTWTLLSWEQKKGDGTKVERYGSSPKGIAFFDAGGRYIITVMRSDRARYASNALWQGTPAENKETADGTITYFGTYSIGEADSSIAIHVEGSSYPNWNGTDQKRLVSIAGERLTLTVRPPAGDVVDVIWVRAT
jgi:hypothetical protein